MQLHITLAAPAEQAFRRQSENRIDVVTVQFDRHRGGFIVELSGCGIDGVTAHWGKDIPASEHLCQILFSTSRRAT
ncbi:DUF4304 domain-containing protein [Paraburkholderia sp. DGU8]|uniref:DUF4304 domain-containing protein n=1 Tax=Paraburkholderia sp. DGU8 TaxID=3161997 RepID=UPI003465C9EB